jgi:hypothetical protein
MNSLGDFTIMIPYINIIIIGVTAITWHAVVNIDRIAAMLDGPAVNDPVDFGPDLAPAQLMAGVEAMMGDDVPAGPQPFRQLLPDVRDEQQRRRWHRIALRLRI